MQDTTSFWTEIKKYEDLLAQQPDSYCYAALAELYRKLGLVNDAIGIAERGCAVHPDFVTGRMELALAYLEKEEKETAKSHLQKVVSAVPENLQAQKLLNQLLMESGDLRTAQTGLQTLLFFHPEDVASQAALESLRRLIGAPATAVAEEDSFSPGLMVEEGTATEEFFGLEAGSEAESHGILLQEDVAPEEQPVPREEVRDPLTTGTLAELYVSQGFVDKAIVIYRELALANPSDAAVLARLKELEYSVRPEMVPETGAVAPPEAVAHSVEAASSGIPETQLETLERWLANITRRKTCHSEAF